MFRLRLHQLTQPSWHFVLFLPKASLPCPACQVHFIDFGSSGRYIHITCHRQEQAASTARVPPNVCTTNQGTVQDAPGNCSCTVRSCIQGPRTMPPEGLECPPLAPPLKLRTLAGTGWEKRDSRHDGNTRETPGLEGRVPFLDTLCCTMQAPSPS